MKREAQEQNGAKDLSQMVRTHLCLSLRKKIDVECDRGLRRRPVFLFATRGVLTRVADGDNEAKPEHDPLRVKLYQILVTV